METNHITAISTTGLSRQSAAKSNHPALKVQPVTHASVTESVTESTQLQVQSLGIQLQVQNSGAPVQSQIPGKTSKTGIQPMKFYMLQSWVPGFSQSSRNNQPNH